MPSASTIPWQIWIDTGGTFTDCLGRDPSNNLHRAKVLSSGALRGRIKSIINPSRILVHQNWDACDDLIRGFQFRLLDRDHASIAVLRFDAAGSMIELSEPLPRDMIENASFEVQSDEPAPILAARLITQTPAGRQLPPIRMRLATTRATNALLERRGAPTALFITKGFGDLLVIGDQQRPDLFAINIQKPPPLYACAVEVAQRMAADGSIIAPLELDQLRHSAKQALQKNIRVAAVALMHSHVNDEHEQIVARMLREIGFEHVSISSELAPMIKLLPRAQTAVVNAYLAPIIDSYLQGVGSHLQCGQGDRSLHVMTSAGGLVRSSACHARDTLLSGPAGGVAGAAAAGRQSGFNQIIGFDMGGTSTDVARFDGDFEYRFEQKIAGVSLLAPALAIETVAAGGGSICEFRDGRLAVGPHSAGAQPGPACYGSGGPLTLTDVNLLLGRLSEEQFEIPIRREPARSALERLQRAMPRDSDATKATSPEELLEGFLDIANERMAAAIEQISVRQGYDPADAALVAFGGAGGQHACAVARRLGMRTVIMPAEASLLSAAGLGHAVIERFSQQQVLATLSSCTHLLALWLSELSRIAIDEVAAEGVSRDRISIRRAIINMRLLGQDSSLAIDLGGTASTLVFDGLRGLFAARYRETYGHDPPPESRKPIEIESLRVIASSPAEVDLSTSHRDVTRFEAQTDLRSRAWFDGDWIDVPAFDRSLLACGAMVRGPALVMDRRSTCVIEPGWSATLDAAAALVARQTNDHNQRSASHQPELVKLELFSNRFASVADEMGQMLQRIALSTNVKERLDFSCALLDDDGELVVNAPHIPVHLGALGVCVRAVREAVTMDDGDVIVTNHPAYGGSHLPDVTVITPVFAPLVHDDKRASTLIGYVASRAHHAEIGGSRPGSMPPSAKSLGEEGVVIPPCHLLRRGQSWFDDIEKLLRSGPFPSRSVNDNLADLQAAVAANHRGATSLRTLAAHFGVDVVMQQMQLIKARAEQLTRIALSELPAARYHAVELLDDGSRIEVLITKQGDRAVIDFAGTAGVHPGNLNATPAIVRSAVIYVLRLLVGRRLPLNEGIMHAVEVRIPQGMLNPPFDVDPMKCPAVVGGNTETSQRVVDTLLKALRLCACSQGTMNNVLFGNEKFGYYETVCGGSGAGPGFNGADAVHCHMTNTRITDPEIIEHRYPVRVDRFGIRRGSGGAGEYRGGDGAVREITFLQPMSLSVLTQHRLAGPYGMESGSPGAAGRQQLVRADATIIELNSIDGCEVNASDTLILQTPGGGGWGEAERTKS